jgi:uncharacterized protein
LNQIALCPKGFDDLQRVNQSFFVVSIIVLITSACVIPDSELKIEGLSIYNGELKRASYQVEIARNNSSRRQGLMFREALPLNQGMLFDYKPSAKMAIWMKNTYIPLDIIFVDDEGMIVKIHEGAEPLSTKQIFSERKVRAVLEINAGQVKSRDISVGDKVTYPSFYR